MRTLVILSAFFCLIACSSDDDNLNIIQTCDFDVSVNESTYQNETTTVSISEVFLSENCLEITYSESGCDGSTWNEQIIASTAIAESNPEQRFVKLLTYNTELCNTIVTKTMTFDLSELQIEGSDEFIINLEGWEEPILYSY